MRYLLLASILLSTPAFADRYLSDGNGGFYVYRSNSHNTGQMFSDFGNRGGLISRMERDRQIQLQNEIYLQQLDQMRIQNELLRRQMGR